MTLAKRQIITIRDQWTGIYSEAQLSEIDRNLLWRRQFLNPYAFEGAPSELADLV